MATASPAVTTTLINGAIARLHFVDDKGFLTRDGVMFLTGMFNRVGGSSGQSIPDLEIAFGEDAGSSETQALVFALGDAFAQGQIIGNLIEQVAELSKQLQDLQAGLTS